MSSQRLYLPFEQVFTNLGAIGAGWQVFTYLTGTTTPKATYSDVALTVPNTNPIVADSAGRFGNIYGMSARDYKFVLKDDIGNTIQTIDPVDPKLFTLADFDPQPASFWGVTSGTSSSYTLASTVDISAVGYQDNQVFLIEFHTTCVANPTLNIDGLGALNLVKQTAQGTTVNLQAGDVVPARYWATNNGAAIVILDPQIVWQLKANTTNSAVFSDKQITITNNISDANNDIDFSAGTTFDQDSNVGFVATAITKRLDATWVIGSGNGGLDTGSKAANTTYHCFSIFNPATNVSDALFSLDPDSPTLPSGFNILSRVGSILTDGSSNIRGFTQTKDVFTLNSSIRDVNAVNQALGSETTRAITTPNGIKTEAFGTAFLSATAFGDLNLKIYSASMSIPTLTALDGQITAANTQFNGASYWRAITNTASQIKTNASGIAGSNEFTLFLDGWRDISL